METFEERKKRVLLQMTELDHSKKGSVDEHAKVLLHALNAHPDYYSTSSCSGRILLLHEPKSRKKNEYNWLFVTHEQANTQEVMKALHNVNAQEGIVWLRMQTVIIHVACKDVAAARKLLAQFSSQGWKRSGIFSVENDIMVELLSVEAMDAPVIVQGKTLVDEDFVREFIALANEKLAIVHEKISSGAQRIQSNL